MANKLTRICIASASVLAVAACSMEDVDTGMAVDHSQSVADRTSSVAYQKGKQNLAAGYLGLALEKFKLALSQDPSSTAVLNALAVTYGRLGRHDLAELYYDRALAIDPTFAVALNNVGYSMARRGRNEEALIYFEQALKYEQLESSRRLILANRQQAMDNLRIAREKRSVEVVEKASLSGASEKPRSDDECELSVGRSIDRSSARVFTLNTAGARHDVAQNRPTVSCKAPVRTRVALINTRSAGGTATISTVRQLASIKPATPAATEKTPPKKPTIATAPQAEKPGKETSAAPAPAVAKEQATPAATEKTAPKKPTIATAPQAEKPGKETSAAPAPAVAKEQATPAATEETAPKKLTIATAPQAEKPGKETSAALAPAVAKEPATPAAVAAADSKAGMAPSLKVEISNGAGRNKLAARMRTYLEAKGLPVSFLTNAARFDNAQTTIFYKSGERAAAEKFAAQLPVAVKFVQTDEYYADIRIRLGADILTFDTSVLYASAYGDVNA